MGAYEDVPRVEIRMGNFVEYVEGVAEIARRGEGRRCEEAAGSVGVVEEADTEHPGMDCLEFVGAEWGMSVKE